MFTRQLLGEMMRPTTRSFWTAVFSLMLVITSIAQPIAAQDLPQASPVANETETPTVVATETPAVRETETPAADETESSAPAGKSVNSISAMAEPMVEYSVPDTSVLVDPTQSFSVAITVTPDEAMEISPRVSISGGAHFWGDYSTVKHEPNIAYEVFHTIPADDVTAACADGGFELRLEVVVRLVSTSESFNLGQPTWDYSCLGDTVISPTLVQPTVVAHCGADNDDVTPAENQPEGVNPTPVVSEWVDGVITLTYAPADGYTFEVGFNPVISVTDTNASCTEPTMAITYEGDGFQAIVPGEPVTMIVTITLPEGHPYDFAQAFVISPLNPFLFSEAEALVSEGIGGDYVIEVPIDPEMEWELVCRNLYISVSVPLFLPTNHTNFAYQLHYSEGIDCGFATSVTPDLGAIGQTAVCGDQNDTFITTQENIEISLGEWTDNSVMVTASAAAGYYIPTDTQSEFEFVDEGPCMVIPVPPTAPVAVCGPNNDSVEVPGQPDGVLVTDTGWVGNERTIAFTADEANGYAIVDEIGLSYLATDGNIPCDETPVGVQLTVILKTSDGGSIEGTSYQVFAPMASQIVPMPYAEGMVNADNRIVLEELLPGEYRLVTPPNGYEPIDTTVSVTEGADQQEITIDVTAIQVAPTPSPEPTTAPTVEPTVQPTVEPTSIPTDEVTVAPTQEPAATAVTGLPQTGTGPDSGSMIIGLSGLLAVALVAIGIGSRRFRA